MGGEDLYWLRFWQSAFALLAVGILVTGSCTMHRNLLINQSISEGNDPVRIVCAYGVDSQHTPCLIQALK